MGLSHVERTQYITQKISEICSYIKLSNNMGHFDANLFMEDFVLLLLNTIFGYQRDTAKLPWMNFSDSAKNA